MAVLKVLRYGDPALRRRAAPVGEVTPEVRATIADMTETMYDEVGIGLAAPQVGVSLRLIVVADEEGRGVQALLNPAIVDRGGEATGEEGCLSIPGVFAPVTRSAWVKIEAQDVHRSSVAEPATGVARGVGEDRGAGGERQSAGHPRHRVARARPPARDRSPRRRPLHRPRRPGDARPHQAEDQERGSPRGRLPPRLRALELSSTARPR